MSNNRLARRRLAALRRRSRQPAFESIEPNIGEIRTFTVGDLSIDSIVLDDHDESAAASDHDCPYCQALATLKEYDAAKGRATPELEQRAREAILFLSGFLSGGADASVDA